MADDDRPQAELKPYSPPWWDWPTKLAEVWHGPDVTMQQAERWRDNGGVNLDPRDAVATEGPGRPAPDLSKSSYHDYAPIDWANEPNTLARSYQVEAGRRGLAKGLVDATAAPEGLAWGLAALAPWIVGPEVLGAYPALLPLLAGATAATVGGSRELGRQRDEATRAADMWRRTGVPGEPTRDLGHYLNKRDKPPTLEEIMGAARNLADLRHLDKIEAPPPAPNTKRSGSW